MNLKNWTAHFFMRFDFLFLDEQNNLYSQCLLFNFNVKLAVFYE